METECDCVVTPNLARIVVLSDTSTCVVAYPEKSSRLCMPQFSCLLKAICALLQFDAVVDANGMQCTHLFVRDPDEALVEGSVHVAIPWRWIRAIDQIVLLRWFPPTPIPLNA